VPPLLLLLLLLWACAPPSPSGLRALQGRSELSKLVRFVKAARDRLEWGPAGPPPLLVKVAPDLNAADRADVAAVVLDSGVDGLVVGNTTISRPDAVAAHPLGAETGGLSGPPLLSLSTSVLSEMYVLTKGRVPIIGCGGVSSGARGSFYVARPAAQQQAAAVTAGPGMAGSTICNCPRTIL
jgi:dihydroorotate dehydrogenase